MTKEKRSSDEQYNDTLTNCHLHWEGPNDHFAEDRMIDSHKNGDEIHLFYRNLHKEPFTYKGVLAVESAERQIKKPSKFIFRLENKAEQGAASNRVSRGTHELDR